MLHEQEKIKEFNDERAVSYSKKNKKLEKLINNLRIKLFHHREMFNKNPHYSFVSDLNLFADKLEKLINTIDLTGNVGGDDNCQINK